MKLYDKDYMMRFKEVSPNGDEHFAEQIVRACGEMSAFAKARGKIKQFEVFYPTSTFELLEVVITQQGRLDI